MWGWNYIVSNLILIVLNAGLGLVLIYVAMRVYTLVKSKDKLLLLIILFLFSSRIVSIYFYIANAIFEFYTSQDSSEDNGPISLRHLIIVGNLPAMLLSIGITLNLRNWVYYFMKIGLMAYH